jgi:hypothetical protein
MIMHVVTIVESILFPQLTEEDRLYGYCQQELAKAHTSGNTRHTLILSDVSGQSY